MSALLAGIVLAPLLSSVLIGLLYMLSITKIPLAKKWFTLPALFAPFLSFCFGLVAFLEVAKSGVALHFEPYLWLSVGEYKIYMGFLGDKLSLFMVLFITFVGWLIHLYATAYMSDDKGYGKFFFYFNLFLSSMLLLVLADGPLIMFIGWEGVGLCSYLLISFYFQDNSNVVAGNKAFIVNRVGDLGFLVGLAILFFYCGDAGFSYPTIAHQVVSMPSSLLQIVGIALFIGAMGKSAQIPLYVWLPDAMAGPTPVSALIHAATMVTAGVYMVARFSFLYDLIPNIGLFIAYIGAFSALFAAVIATKQSDIKKILAYSTMSQLGYMFIAVGLGAYSSALFHVFTHAFFKALLFMGAGAVIIALHHEQNIFKMGKMRRVTPVVYLTMLMATLAISGIPPFAGFFSKDEILLVAFASGEYVIWGIAVCSAVLTAYYMFRLFFVVFEGKNALHVNPPHDVSWVMKAPLVVLALGSLLAGFMGLPSLLGGSHLLGSWLGEWGMRAISVSHETEWLLLGLNVAISLLGIGIAYQKFYGYDLSSHKEAKGIVYNKFYIDEIYDVLFVRSIRKLSEFIAVGLDVNIVDRVIMGLSHGFIKLGHVVALVQNANVRFYALIMMLGISVASCYLIWAVE
ncbi:NADH-quinone oxidoreductase subunit L [Sulfurospirillum halorespirans]|uniref:NADH-ubiquinone oxidoreductase chain L n=1 Tax=Sulfurospirillum halorespirans DSM 13726 TaxID=1193502 RepID=A0A1D7TH46_9BACT|nr:NADH-quinone oxidoreductase subunit L [Sulfurospirillum halorespirans]AOO64296.1 NADH-ubiquinone oxidoreductase chain L [Sulfurospirillum halorespirans DSM 13726]